MDGLNNTKDNMNKTQVAKELLKIANSLISWGGDDYDSNHYYNRYYSLCAQQIGNDEVSSNDLKEMLRGMKDQQNRIKKRLDSTKKNNPDSDTLNELENEFKGIGEFIQDLKKAKTFDSLSKKDGYKWNRATKKWLK